MAILFDVTLNGHSKIIIIIDAACYIVTQAYSVLSATMRKGYLIVTLPGQGYLDKFNSDMDTAKVYILESYIGNGE